MTQKTSVRFYIGLLTMMLCVFVISAAIAEQKENEKTEPVAEEKESTGAFGMKAGKDSDGAIRPPNPSEENKLNAELKKTLNKYSKHNPKQEPNGAVSLVVAPHRMSATVAHIGPDGKVHMNCIDAAGHATANPQTKEELPEE